VDSRVAVNEAQASGRFCRHCFWSESEGTGHSKMNVDDNNLVTLREEIEKIFSNNFNFAKFLPINAHRSLCKPAIRARGFELLPHQLLAMCMGYSVRRMTLNHGCVTVTAGFGLSDEACFDQVSACTQ